MLKKKRIRYLAKDVTGSYREELELLKHVSVTVECDYVKRYFSSMLILMKLSRSERILLDFITEEMDQQNIITNSCQIRNRFNELMTKIGQENYSESTIHKCFSGLSENCLLEKINGRGMYQVNPLFFFKGTEEDRVKLIRKNLESINKEPINKYRRNLIIQKTISLSEELLADSNA